MNITLLTDGDGNSIQPQRFQSPLSTDGDGGSIQPGALSDHPFDRRRRQQHSGRVISSAALGD
jgi:hypothetical protein